MQVVKDMPDHHDADLVLKLYDLRREPVMRESRQAMLSQFRPRAAADAVAVTQADHPLNPAYRQVFSYWEMVFGMARHGIVHPDYLVENSGEGLLLFVRAEPYLKQIREATSPRFAQHAEWVAAETAVGRTMTEGFRIRWARLAEAPKK